MQQLNWILKDDLQKVRGSLADVTITIHDKGTSRTNKRVCFRFTKHAQDLLNAKNIKLALLGTRIYFAAGGEDAISLTFGRKEDSPAYLKVKEHALGLTTQQIESILGKYDLKFDNMRRYYYIETNQKKEG